MTPVPVSGMFCGLPAALSTIDSVPVRAPLAVGVNVTFTWQLAPTAIGAPRQLVCPAVAAATAKLPVAVRLLTVSRPLPVFATVTVFAGDVVPTLTPPNARPAAADGVVVTAGAVAAATVTV